MTKKCDICRSRKYRYYNFQTDKDYCSECYVEHLASELTALRESLRWHKYPEKKPEEGIKYDIILNSGLTDKPIVDTGYYYEIGKTWSANSTRGCTVIAYRKRPAPYGG